jgi:hypothetical protein
MQLAPTVTQQFSAHAMVEKTLAAYEQAAKMHHQKRLTYV